MVVRSRASDILLHQSMTMTNHLSNHKKTGEFSQVSESIFSSYIQSEYSNLVAFTERLFQYIEQRDGGHGSGYYLNTVRDNRDVDRVDEDLLIEIQREVANAFPRNFAADPRLFYKKITDFYRSRGTPESIKSFFRYLYNDNVDVYFPKDEILIPSDGRYFPTDDQIIDDPENYEPLYTFTITDDGTTEITGADDIGRVLQDINTPLIFIIRAGTTEHIRVLISEREIELLPQYKIKFIGTELNENDVVEIHQTGTFTTNDGFLSDNKKVQDSVYYQLFSYVLRTGTSSDIWRIPFNHLVHPSGFAFFGEILFSTIIDIGIPQLQPGRQQEGLLKYVSPLIEDTILPIGLKAEGMDFRYSDAMEIITPFRVGIITELDDSHTLAMPSRHNFDANKFFFNTAIHYFGDYVIGEHHNIDSIGYESNITISTVTP